MSRSSAQPARLPNSDIHANGNSHRYRVGDNTYGDGHDHGDGNGHDHGDGNRDGDNNPHARRDGHTGPHGDCCSNPRH